MPPAFAFEEMPGFQHQFLVPDLTCDVRSVSEHNFGRENQYVICLAVYDDFGGNKSAADPCWLRNQNSVGPDLTFHPAVDDKFTG